MPNREQIVSLVQRYVAAVDAQDVDAATALFTEDGHQEDPVGDGPNVGHAAIREFFEQSFSVPFEARLEGPVTVHGRFAAFRIRIEIAAGRTPFLMLITDLVEVSQDGRFSSLRAVPDSKALSEPDHPARGSSG
ncbi:MAG: nuclear transport factor 2 family protein [Actinomycetota bacterium]|nr:nuclear transport factor 2 family protein [Actinomycetota bacterium]